MVEWNGTLAHGRVDDLDSGGTQYHDDRAVLRTGDS